MRIHSIIVPKCHVVSSPIAGVGVFAVEPFEPDELVAVWGGKVYTAEECSKLGSVFPHCKSYPISLYDNYYMGTENLFEMDDTELFNHSCAPNIGVRGQVIVVARRHIEAGEELTFDYDTTEIDCENEAFQCQCATSSCRGWINGSSWRDPAFIERNRRYMSW